MALMSLLSELNILLEQYSTFTDDYRQDKIY